MAEIAPFKGIRYNESKVGDMNKVVSPPYDIISPEDRIHYHQIHPNNFVRLVLGEEFPDDNDSNNRFTRAKSYLDEWIQTGVLKQDEKPAIYIYQQLFERDSERKAVRGFICAAKLHEYSDDIIMPHEQTLAKPKSQLAVLIRETKANLDSIYGLYGDENCVLDEVMDRAMAEPPAEAARDKDGVEHRLWVIDDPGDISKVVEFLSDKKIAIADGHHRYETALAYRNEVREKMGCKCCEIPANYVMMTLVNVYEKDMTIYPTHRVLGNLPQNMFNALEEGMKDMFEIKDSTKESLLSDMAKDNAIGMYKGGTVKTLKLKADPEAVLSGSLANRKLELNVLHKLIMEPLLGIDDEKLRNQTNVIYTRDAQEAFDLVDSGQRQVAFMLNHIAVKSVLDIASAGEKMPQKATYFYPKLLSGLVLRRL